VSGLIRVTRIIWPVFGLILALRLPYFFFVPRHNVQGTKNESLHTEILNSINCR